MTKYVRLWTCGVCKHQVIYDSETKTVSCHCGTVRALPSAKELNEKFEVVNLDAVV